MTAFLCGLPLERGVNPRAYGQSALIHAAECGHIECVRILVNLPLERGVEPAACNNRALRLAANNGHMEVVRLLCSLPRERGVHQSEALAQALHGGAIRGHAVIVAFLSKYVDAQNPWRSSALQLSTRDGHSDVVHALLEAQADSSWRFALKCAAKHGHLDIVLFTAEALHLRGDKKLSACLSSAVGQAAAEGHAAVVKALCDLPPEFGVNIARSDGREHVWMAAVHGHAEVVKVMCSLPVARGVSVACGSRHGDSALQYAALSGHIRVVRYLCSLPLDRGVDPSWQSYTPLRYAACRDQVDVLRELYGTLWERNLVQPQGMLSVLEAAVECNAPRCVRFLCTITRPCDSETMSAMAQSGSRVNRPWVRTAAHVVHHEILWQHPRSILSIASLLQSRRASARFRPA